MTDWVTLGSKAGFSTTLDRVYVYGHNRFKLPYQLVVIGY